MVSTKESPGAFDGMERAQPGEPVFTLRAHDPLAAALVHEWVSRKRDLILKSDLTEEKRKIELIQCREAEEIAFAMRDWHDGLSPSPVEPDDDPDYQAFLKKVEDKVNSNAEQFLENRFSENDPRYAKLVEDLKRDSLGGNTETYDEENDSPFDENAA